MASANESKNASEGIPDNEPNKLTCAVCLEKFRRPKLLPCFHTFCQSCIQAVVGTSASFPCPACRTIVIIPPSGVAAFTNNFYVEQELDLSAVPAQRLCDVCTEDREATYTCIQCHQRFCLPCRRFHDTISLSRGHSVVPLTLDVSTEGACCGKALESSATGGRKGEEERCQKHTDQRLVLRCIQCSQTICLQCKLTRHEGHPTEDLMDTRSRARTMLQSILQDLTLQIQRLENATSALCNQETGVEKERAAAEGVMRQRRDVLIDWANQSYIEALHSVQVATDQSLSTLKSRAETAKSIQSALQAKQDHLSRVLNVGNVADLVLLEGQFTEAPMDVSAVRRVEKEVTNGIPRLEVGHDHAAVNHPQMRVFVGVLATQENLNKSEAISAQTDAARVNSGYVSAVSQRGAVSSALVPNQANPGSSCEGAPLKTREQLSKSLCQLKRAPKEMFSPSKDTFNTFITLSYFGKGRLFIDSCLEMLFLDQDGSILYTIKNSTRAEYGCMYVLDDIILQDFINFNYDNQIASRIKMIEPAIEKRSTFVVDFTVLYMFSSAACGLSIVHQEKDNTSGDIISVHFSSKVPLKWTINCLMKKNVIGYLCDVSNQQLYFAFLDYATLDVTIYMKSSENEFLFCCSYTTTYKKVGAYFAKPHCYSSKVKFCLINQKEVLLITMPGDNQVHVVDHTDDCRFLCYLDTGKVTMPKLKSHTTYTLATDYYHHVWIGCEGMRVVVVYL